MEGDIYLRTRTESQISGRVWKYMATWPNMLVRAHDWLATDGILRIHSPQTAHLHIQTTQFRAWHIQAGYVTHKCMHFHRVLVALYTVTLTHCRHASNTLTNKRNDVSHYTSLVHRVSEKNIHSYYIYRSRAPDRGRDSHTDPRASIRSFTDSSNTVRRQNSCDKFYKVV